MPEMGPFAAAIIHTSYDVSFFLFFNETKLKLSEFSRFMHEMGSADFTRLLDDMNGETFPWRTNGGIKINLKIA